MKFPALCFHSSHPGMLLRITGRTSSRHLIGTVIIGSGSYLAGHHSTHWPAARIQPLSEPERRRLMQRLQARSAKLSACD